MDRNRYGPSVDIMAYGSVSPLAAERRLLNRRESTGLAGPSVPAEADGVSWREILRYKGTIGLVFTLVAALGLIAIWNLKGPKYVATAKIHVRPIIPRLVFQTEETGPMPFYESYTNTQIDFIRNPKVLQRVLETPAVRKTQWYQTHGGSVDALAEAIQAEHSSGTETIDVSLGAAQPEEAALLVNTVLKEYLRFVRESNDEDQDYVYRKLSTEYNALQSEIDRRLKVLAQLRRQIGTGTPDVLVSEKRVRLDKAEAKVAEVEQEIALAERQQGILQDQRSRGAQSRVPFAYDAEWARLNAVHESLVRDLKTSLQTLGDRHHKVIGLRESVKHAEERLRERETQLNEGQGMPGVSEGRMGDSGAGREPIPLSQRIGILKFKKELLVAALRKQEQEFERTFTAAQLLSVENEAIRHKRELRDAIRARLDQKLLERNIPGSIEILAEAMVPSKPAKDRRWKLSVVLLLVAMVSGVGAGQYRARTNPTVREAKDVYHLVDKPFLGQLPLIRGQSAGPEDTFMQDEYVRMIRTALLRRMKLGQRSVIAVTSAAFGVGKTTVATLLAKSIAQCEIRTLLVEADLRRPVLADRLRMPPGPGLIDLLKEAAQEGEVIHPSEYALLDLLPAGRSPAEFRPEMFSGGLLRRSLDRWRGQYDVIVLDTPPILPVADTRILAGMADGTIMVVRENYCHREDLMEAMEFLDVCGARFLGMVYIGAIRRGRQYGYTYDAGQNGKKV